MSDLQKAYTILGLEPGSSKDEIQKRYKRLAVAWHPDRFPSPDAKADAEAELKKILNAKDLLIKHFDGGKHKLDACECTGKAAAAAPAPAKPAASDVPPVKKPAAEPQRPPTAADAIKEQEARQRPSEDQIRRWAKLEKQLEREEAQQEQAQQRELLERFFEQQKEEVPKPKLKTARKAKVKPTIQDQLNNLAGNQDQHGWPEKVQDFFQFYFDEFKMVLLSPIQYFESMDLEGGFREPVTFVCLIAAVNGLVWLGTSLTHPVGAALATMGIIAASFALAGVTMGLSRWLGGDGDFEATYRACGAAMAPWVVLFIPFVNVFAVLYSLLLLKLSLERSQDLTPTRCTAVVGMQVVVGAIFVALAIGTGMAQLMGGKGQ
jgi:hypothetical protein